MFTSPRLASRLSVLMLAACAPAAREPVVPTQALVSGATPAVVSPEMVSISAGTFLMGDPAVEKPAPRAVRVQAFRLDRTEVTAGAYASCVDAGACSPPRAPSRSSDDNCTYGRPERVEHPVNCMTVAQAMTYCKWAGKRLPTEEEWEYAARGKASFRHPWGAEPPVSEDRHPQVHTVCWNFRETCTVGSHPAGRSPFGIDDMVGNVEEITSSSYVYGPPHEILNEDDNFIVRGGSYYLPAEYLTPTARLRWVTREQEGESHRGFRCAASAP